MEAERPVRSGGEHAVEPQRVEMDVEFQPGAEANETIDTEAERLAAARDHIPGSVWLLPLTVASLGCITSSYASGAEGERSAFSGIVLPFLVAVVITVIFDLADPRRGLIRITRQPLVDLQQSMQATQR